MTDIEAHLLEAMENADAWMALNAQCTSCSADMVTITAPISTRLTGFKCGACGQNTVMPLRVLMASGVPIKTAGDVVTIKSLERQALASMYEMEEQDGK